MGLPPTLSPGPRRHPDPGANMRVFHRVSRPGEAVDSHIGQLDQGAEVRRECGDVVLVRELDVDVGRAEMVELDRQAGTNAEQLLQLLGQVERLEERDRLLHAAEHDPAPSRSSVMGTFSGSRLEHDLAELERRSENEGGAQ